MNDDDDRMAQLLYEGLIFAMGAGLALTLSVALGLSPVATMAVVILCASATGLVLFRLGAG